MNKKLLTVIIALIVLFAGATAFLLLTGNKEPDTQGTETEGETYTLFEIPSSSLKEVEVNKADFNIKAVNTGDSEWTIDGENAEEISPQKAFGLAGTVSNLTSRNRYDAPEDLSAYGLDNPSVTVTLRLKEGTENKLYIGDLSASLGEYFVMKDGDDAVYTIYKHKVDAMLEPISYYKEFNRLTLNADDITGVKIERGGDDIEIKIRDDIDEFTPIVWEMTAPYESSANDDYIDGEILEPISNLELTTPIDNADGGFTDKSPIVTVTILTHDEESGELNGGSYTETFTVGKAEGDNTYVKYGGKVFLVPTENVEFVNDSAFNIVSKLQLMENIADIKSVTVEYGGASHKIEVSRDSNNKYSFKTDGKDADTEKSQTIYESLISLSVDSAYTGGDLGETALKITYEGADGNDNTTIEVKRVGDINSAVVKNDKTEFMIRYAKIQEFTEEFDEYLRSFTEE